MKEELNPDLTAIIEATVRRTVTECEQRQRVRAIEAMTRNTTTLVENYTTLTAYASTKTPGTTAQWGDAFLESIASSKARTSIMVAELDLAMDQVATEYRAAGQSYKWDAFRARYMAGESYEAIADRLNAGKNSPARWCKEIMQQVAIRLFGVDGLKRW